MAKVAQATDRVKVILEFSFFWFKTCDIFRFHLLCAIVFDFMFTLNF